MTESKTHLQRDRKKKRRKVVEVASLCMLLRATKHAMSQQKDLLPICSFAAVEILARELLFLSFAPIMCQLHHLTPSLI